MGPILTPGSSSDTVPADPSRKFVSQCLDTGMAVHVPSVQVLKKKNQKKKTQFLGGLTGESTITSSSPHALGQKSPCL